MSEQKPEGVTVALNAGLGALLPCPFCGGAEVAVRPGYQDITFCCCGTCHAVVSFGGRERMSDTRKAWNGRAPNAKVQP